jgi:hypothetical protein
MDKKTTELGSRLVSPLCNEYLAGKPQAFWVPHTACTECPVCPKVLEDLDYRIPERVEIPNHLPLGTGLISAFQLREMRVS